jgi:hypothetical protein
VKIVKNDTDPPLFTGKLLIKFQNILRNTTQVIIRQGKNPIFRHIKSNNSGTAKVKIVKNCFLTIFTFATPELLDLI